jgi:hypothetical protein
MLDELKRRNYAKTTVQYYIQAVEQFAKHFHRPPDQLNQTHLREYQAFLLRDRRLEPRTVKLHVSATSRLLSSTPAFGVLNIAPGRPRSVDIRLPAADPPAHVCGLRRNCISRGASPQVIERPGHAHDAASPCRAHLSVSMYQESRQVRRFL